MTNTIRIKNSNVAGRVPTTSNLQVAELGLNTTDKKLYSSDGTNIFEIGNNNTFYSSSNLDITNLVVGTTQGSLIEGLPGGHLVLGIRGDNAQDGFHIIDKGNATNPLTDLYLNALFSVTRSSGVNTILSITSPNFIGPLTGNASTASILQTSRTINGTSFNGSTNITTSNWGTSRTLTIGATAKSVNGSGNITWTRSEVIGTPPTIGAFFSNTPPIVDSNGVLEIGRYIDFHSTNTTTADFDVRVDCSAPNAITFYGTASVTLTAGSFAGSGASLTSLNASNLSSGIVPDARISGSYTGLTNLTGSGTATFAVFKATNNTGGWASLQTGSATQAGLLQIYKSDGTTTLGYIGWSNTDLTYASENGANHIFSGGIVNITNTTATTSTTTGALVVTGGIGVGGGVTAIAFAGNGGALTSLNASQLTAGTIPDARLTGSYTGLTNLTGSGTATFNKYQATGLSTSWGVTSGVNTGGLNTVMGTSTGATWLLSGTSGGVFRYGIQGLDSGNFLRFYAGANSFYFNNDTLYANAFSGSGASLTSLNATNISSGTLADARLSSNVVLLTGTQTFSGAKTFSEITTISNATASTSTTTGALVVVGGVGINGTLNAFRFAGNSSDTVSAPSFTWTGDENTGMYHLATDQIGFTNGGAISMLLTSTYQMNYGNIYITSPDNIAADATTTTRDSSSLYLRGFYWNGTASTIHEWNILNDITAVTPSSTLRFRAAGIDRLTVDNTGTVTATLFSGSGASLTNLNASNLISGNIPAARLGSTDYSNFNNVGFTGVDGYGIRFFNSDSYKIYMSAWNSATWGGRLDSTSDYNMYFKMTGGTNRGFVFENSTTPVAQIDGNGNFYTAGGYTFSTNPHWAFHKPLGTVSGFDRYYFRRSSNSTITGTMVDLFQIRDDGTTWTSSHATIGGNIYLSGALLMDGNNIIDAGGGWHRSYGDTGWYNGTYAGGMYMIDTTWVRTYNSKSLYSSNNLGVAGAITVINGVTPNNGAIRLTPNLHLNSGGTTNSVIVNWDTGGSVATDIMFRVGNGNSDDTMYVRRDGFTSIIGTLRFAGGGGVPTEGNCGVITWNSINGGQGTVEFVDYCGTGGSTCFAFYRVPNIGKPTTSNIIASINQAGTYNVLSDERVKKDIKDIEYGLNTVLALKPRKYNHYVNNRFNNGKVENGEIFISKIGLIAQEVGLIIPEIVEKPENEKEGFYSLDYTSLIPILIKAIQEQQDQIEVMKDTIKLLMSRINRLENIK